MPRKSQDPHLNVTVITVPHPDPDTAFDRIANNVLKHILEQESREERSE